VNFEVQDAETLSFPDNTFDAVVARTILAPIILPVGIMTYFIGVPFLYLSIPAQKDGAIVKMEPARLN
jgi:hypothetical protein